MDTDGRLSCEEFVLAMHLCDLARSGEKIPVPLPADLVPPSLRRQRQNSIPSTAEMGDPLAGMSGVNTKLRPISEAEMLKVKASSTVADHKYLGLSNFANLDKKKKIHLPIRTSTCYCSGQLFGCLLCLFMTCEVCSHDQNVKRKRSYDWCPACNCGIHPTCFHSCSISGGTKRWDGRELMLEMTLSRHY
ncbi:Intersectin 1 (SH3 domain protein) [Homalodisca vitripennis]|nr:Intersectin 1 (SH3 domain protein) [Homalodisca vitripennis]